MESIQVSLLILTVFLNLPTSEQITVTFGTNTGPISIPITPVPPVINRHARKVPAPVFEIPEDVPNPISYKPIIPREYRTKLLSFFPNPNLILGTPLDQKYTFNYDKYNLYQKQQALGKQYRGPHVFDKQTYHFLQKSLKHAYEQENTPNSQSLQVETPNSKFYQNVRVETKSVPEIGVLYTSGVKFYVPQVVYNGENEDQLNSVYDQNDTKYYSNE